MGNGHRWPFFMWFFAPKSAPHHCNPVDIKPPGRLFRKSSPHSLFLELPTLHSYHKLCCGKVQLLRERLPAAAEGIRLPVRGSRWLLGRQKIRLSCAIGIDTYPRRGKKGRNHLCSQRVKLSEIEHHPCPQPTLTSWGPEWTWRIVARYMIGEGRGRSSQYSGYLRPCCVPTGWGWDCRFHFDWAQLSEGWCGLSYVSSRVLGAQETTMICQFQSLLPGVGRGAFQERGGKQKWCPL